MCIMVFPGFAAARKYSCQNGEKPIFCGFSKRFIGKSPGARQDIPAPFLNGSRSKLAVRNALGGPRSMSTTTEKPVTQAPDADFFNLKGQLLAQGRQDTVLAETDLLKLRLKVYASGGENAMHMHPYEDHAFIVIQGQATFHINTDDNVKVVNKGEGVMLPRRCGYWFQSSAPENLVMIRVGAAEKWPDDGRAFLDGKPFAGDSKENKQVEVIPMDGKYFSL
jgi:mannose-6-phosphate isomerase-like protein (cupin superfamily)